MNNIITTLNINDYELIVIKGNIIKNKIDILNIYKKNTFNFYNDLHSFKNIIKKLDFISNNKTKNIYITISNLNIKIVNIFINIKKNKKINNLFLYNIIKKNKFFLEIFKKNIILHIIPNYYVLDNIFVNNPVNLYCKNIKISFIFIYCKKKYISNIKNIINKIKNIKIKNFFYESLISFYSIKYNNIKVNNFFFIDIKFNKAHIFIYYQGFIKYIKILKLGYNIIYKSISIKYNLDLYNSYLLQKKIFSKSKKYIKNIFKKNKYIKIYNKKIKILDFLILVKNNLLILFNNINNYIYKYNIYLENNNIIIKNILLLNNNLCINFFLNDINKIFTNKKMFLLNNNIINFKNNINNKYTYTNFGLFKYLYDILNKIIKNK